MISSYFTPAEIEQYQQNGFLLIEDFLDIEEALLLQQASHNDAILQKAAMDVKDAAGRRTNLSVWNHPGDDIYGVIARSERVVNRMEQLLDDEVYHYHSKLSAKEPRVGGAWEWHQDYGYWYKNGCLLPTMASVFIAVDPATRENGCMQVLTGSHRMGRIDHHFEGEQTGADLERVELAKQRFPLFYCEMKAGTALFFDGNLLHRSDPNLSDFPRWGLICCYNTKTNDPLLPHHHPGYTPLSKLPDSTIRETGVKTASLQSQFLKQAEDRTSRILNDAGENA
ncbi:phytanoyl-CoA dioxygenase family protein [uncultured Rubinisphaera sp.]|uniref:phytanoyl-CoA dioxygenase family protein n=1 Tax=uncultured Rubinisphaera sp. TaxID=1678686 RepID=UPI0030DB7B6D